MMDIKHRQQEVKELVCKACQDLIRLLLPENWQQTLFTEFENNIQGKFANTYLGAYGKMCDKGIENYQIEDMDTALIANLVRFSKNIKATGTIQKAIKEVSEERNLYGHSSENEDEDELYLRALLSLAVLRNFIRTVHMYEIHIDKSKRLAYRQKYIKSIEDLMSVLDEERIELVQRDKDIEKDIQRVLNSDTPERLWIKLEEAYNQRYWGIEKDPERCIDFWIRSSDAGIKIAHSAAVTGYLMRKDYVKATSKIILCYKESPYDRTQSIVRDINDIIFNTGRCPQELEIIIEDLRKQGKHIEKAKLEKPITDKTGYAQFKQFEGYVIK